MEAFGIYVLKSAAWISCFAIVYLLFLRNERFFRLNRLFLLSGIVTAFIFPFITLRYQVVVPLDVESYSAVSPDTVAVPLSAVPANPRLMLMVLYIAGAVTVMAAAIRQIIKLTLTIRKSEIVPGHSAQVIRTPEYPASFSFFSYVFVNPSVTDAETDEILNHEIVHIRQKHWVDLLLAKVLCIVQWFNPMVWVYTRLIRQNHEYLADEEALQRSSDRAVYMATLLNQIVGTPVIDLANSFNYSLNKKRFNMMKNIITSPYRKIKTLLILPVIAGLMWSFAEPEYILPAAGNAATGSNASDQEKEVRGIVTQKNGTPLQGAVIVVQSTTIGTVADDKGKFKLEGLNQDASLVVSYVGFKTKKVKPVFTSEMKITLDQDTVKLSKIGVPPPPPPPPPPPSGSKNEAVTVTGYANAGAPPPPPPPSGSKSEEITVVGYANAGAPPPPPPPPAEIMIKSKDGKKPLIIVDGKEQDVDLTKLDPNSILSISVWKDQAAIDKYGEKGKDGVLEVKMKGPGDDKDALPVYSQIGKTKATGDETMVVTEEMPMFPGGEEAMKKWVYGNIRIQKGMDYKTVNEPIHVVFTVGKDGKVRDTKVVKSVSPLFDAEAVRVVSSMPDFNPGKQNGKPIDVRMMLPIDFSIKVPAK